MPRRKARLKNPLVSKRLVAAQLPAMSSHSGVLGDLHPRSLLRVVLSPRRHKLVVLDPRVLDPGVLDPGVIHFPLPPAGQEARAVYLYATLEL